MPRMGCDVRDVWNDEAIAEAVDLLIYQSVIQPAQPNDRMLCGVEYVMIDPAYAGLQPDFDGPIVVSMGGSDHHEMTPRVVEALAGAGRKVKVIVGTVMTDREWSDWPDSVEVFIKPTNLLPHLDGAALLIGALGMTAYEAAAAGVPSLLVGWTDDHLATALELEQRGVCNSLGLWTEFDAGYLRNLIGGILTDQIIWKPMSAAGKALVDGRGVERVADRIMEVIGDNP
jgi:spore coat polysaccharide biosynthesis predicted glycosyltransferase SpsG